MAGWQICVDLQTWDDEISGRDDSYELVDGVPTSVPEESVDNRTAGTAPAYELRRQVVHAAVATDVEVTISEVPTLCRPPR